MNYFLAQVYHITGFNTLILDHINSQISQSVNSQISQSFMEKILVISRKILILLP